MDMEELLFSCVALKFNKKDNIKDIRTIALTEDYFMNLKDTEVKRKINVSSIEGFTKSQNPDNLQFVIHIKDEQDDRFEVKTAAHLDEIITTISRISTDQKGSSPTVYLIPKHMSLETFTRTKRDIARGRNMRPATSKYGKENMTKTLNWSTKFESEEGDKIWQGPFKIETSTLDAEKIEITGTIDWSD